MTQKAMKRLTSLNGTTERYSSTIQRKLSKGDGKNTAMLQSAAKYYIAIKKLADK